MWYQSPTRFGRTSILSIDYDAPVLVGLKDGTHSDDSGHVAWVRRDNKWCICKYNMNPGSLVYPFDPPVTFRDDTLRPGGYPVNDAPCWIWDDTGVGRALWYGHYRNGGIVSSAWMIADKSLIGSILDKDSEASPFWYNNATTTPHADYFYPSTHASGTYSTSIDTWERWTSLTKYGRYTPEGTVATGNKFIGLPEFKGDGVIYLRSLRKDQAYHKYTYGEGPGAIHYGGAFYGWVIGNPLSPDGWYQSASEPSIDVDVTFTWTTVPEQDPQPPWNPDKLVRFNGYYRADLESRPTFYGEAAIWRT